MGLLERDEGEPVIVVNQQGPSPYLLLCEHAGRVIPRKLGDLGLPESERLRHIAWDIGAEGVSRHLSRHLDAPLVMQRYSRLVYDCNRPPESPGAIPEVSETTEVPRNRGLAAAERQERIDELYLPYHRRVGDLIQARLAAGAKPVIVAIHSYTPVYKGQHRAVEFGVLHDQEARLAHWVLAAAEAWPGILSRRNEPYGPQDGVCHTLNLHTVPHGLMGVMLEIRHDHIREEVQEAAWAERLAALFRAIARAQAWHAG